MHLIVRSFYLALSWLRHLVLRSRRRQAAGLTAALVVLAGSLTGWRVLAGSPPCGPGLTLRAGTSWSCVGLDLESRPMQRNDPLADLYDRVAHLDAGVKGNYAAVVLLEDMTPDLDGGVEGLPVLRHSIEGAIVAVQRANTLYAAGLEHTQIKLLLANFGNGCDASPDAVQAIIKYQHSAHIAAVSGIGASFASVQTQIAHLSGVGISTVAANVTATGMNFSPSGKRIKNFFRVSPTNKSEVLVLADYMREKKWDKHKVMLINDANRNDIYASSLTQAFKDKFGSAIKYPESYNSSQCKKSTARRAKSLNDRFASIDRQICLDNPDLILFSGRGADARTWLQDIATGNPCPNLRKTLTVITGSDGINIAATPLPRGVGGSAPSISATIYYAALAIPGEWRNMTGSIPRTESKSYNNFATIFKEDGYNPADLNDGTAMISHDAVLTAIQAIRNHPGAITDPGSLAGHIHKLRCSSSVLGASGYISIRRDGNPDGKDVPIVQLTLSGKPVASGANGPRPAEGPIDYSTHECPADHSSTPAAAQGRGSR